MLEVIACILIADLITGVVHWVEDTYGVPTWPWLGRAIVEPNIRHHADPVHFTTGSILWRNYQAFAAAAAAIGGAWLLGVCTWQWELVCVLASLGNEVHAWAHKRPQSRLIRLLQDTKLILSPEQHAKHHRAPYTTNYCSLTNWLNPLLDAVGFWRALEWALLKAGIAPARCTAARRGY